jgi:hypothetical protein
LTNLNQAFHLPGLRRITMFVGAYGSGKSEVSVNFALWLATQGYAALLGDLDIINPYYRSSDAGLILENAGIRLVKPAFAGTNVDVPAVPAAIFSAFDDRSLMAVIDIGGEDLGARVVATLKTHLARASDAPAMYMVVNPFRPFTDTPGKICQVASELSQAAGWPVSGLVHNANLMGESDIGLLESTWPAVSEAASLLSLPVVFAAALDKIAPASWQGKTPWGVPLLRLERLVRYPGDL